MVIDANTLEYDLLNQQIRSSNAPVINIDNCLGQRYIGSGLSNCRLQINGVPGNALGAYLDGAEIVVYGNAQDATGDTMNAGSIVIHGSSGDATGYSMRGGEIMIKGNAGYRAGIHMKSYEDTCPVMVIGGVAGSFLGEYQAGGLIIVLGLGSEDKAPFGYYCGTGMHGGKMIIRTSHLPGNLPAHVQAEPAKEQDLADVMPYLERYCSLFGAALPTILNSPFHVLTPNTKSPYKLLYTPT